MSWFRRKPKPKPERWFVEVVLEEPYGAIHRLPRAMDKRGAENFAAMMNDSTMRLTEATRGCHFWCRAVKEEAAE